MLHSVFIYLFILDIKTDTICIQVTTVFTLVQVRDGATYYHVVLEMFPGKEIVVWKVQLTTPIWKIIQKTNSLKEQAHWKVSDEELYKELLFYTYSRYLFRFTFHTQG